MDWQLAAALTLVTAAVAYLAQAGLRVWRGAKTGCGGGCSCPSTQKSVPAANGRPTLIPRDSLGFRRKEA